MTTLEIQSQIRSHFIDYDYKLRNVFLYAWESDFFCISKSGYAIEVEVKVSRSDFFADMKKVSKHALLSQKDRYRVVPGKEYNETMFTPNGYYRCPAQYLSIHDKFLKAPNRFYYAVPRDMVSVDEVPKYAGLIYCGVGGARVVNQAHFLHKHKQDLTADLLSKYYHKSMNARRDLQSLSWAMEWGECDNPRDEVIKIMDKYF